MLTLGENGSIAFEKSTEDCTFFPALKVQVVSTVGAGDSFGAAFLNAYLGVENLKTCLEKGAKRSAFVVAHQEAVPEENEPF